MSVTAALILLLVGAIIFGVSNGRFTWPELITGTLLGLLIAGTPVGMWATHTLTDGGGAIWTTLQAAGRSTWFQGLFR